jgi:beta-lactamase regulating signal transducer with metallopeptidase domain
MLVSSDITVPIVCNPVRPAILLPAAALEWSDERCDSVLLHELAHVRRMDLITAQAAHLAVLMFWFHPLIWFAARRQRAEAERACDDCVLQAGGRASAYANDLLEIARHAVDREPQDAAALAMARRSQLEGRLLAILDPKRPARVWRSPRHFFQPARRSGDRVHRGGRATGGGSA